MFSVLTPHKNRLILSKRDEVHHGTSTQRTQTSQPGGCQGELKMENQDAAVT